MPQYGMNIDPNANHGIPARHTDLGGVKWVRLVFNAEQHPHDSFDQLCVFYGGIVDSFAASGIRTLIVLNHQIAMDFRRAADGSINQDYIDKFAARCGQIAQAFKGKSVAYEIWNEEDQASESAAGVRKEVFKPLLAATCAQIKAADPNAKRIFGGLVSGDPIGYVKACLDDQGNLPVHAIGIHPYTKFYDPSGLAAGLKRVSATFGVHVWVTEFDDGNINTPDQDQLAADSLPAFVNQLPSIVDTAIWYCWSDSNPGFGLVDANGNPKAKVYPAFLQVVGGAAPIVDGGHGGGDIPTVHPASSFTNQNLIDAFFAAAQATNVDVWKLMANAGVGFLASIKSADRKKAYTGAPIDSLPNLTPEQVAAIKQALPQPGVEDMPAPAPDPAAPASPSDFKLNIQWFTQMDKHGHGNNDCGDASVFMLLEYYGLAVPSKEEVFNVLQGKTGYKQLIGLAKNYGLDITSEATSVDALPALLKADKPVIFPVEYKFLGFPLHLASPAQGGKGVDQGPHWLVVVGYDDKGFFVHDPLWMPAQRNGQGGAFLHIDHDTLNAALLPYNMLYKAD